MPRSKSSSNSDKQKKKIFRRAKGFVGSRKNHYRTAKEAVVKKFQNAYKGRKQKKRGFRRLWITRINIASRALGLSYNRLIEGLDAAKIIINRKTLSELAINDKPAFEKIVDAAKKALSEKK
ncbi:50S ribosomal protein L20 [Candidatus Dependentiae bacterium]|nr:50S ribosomal protein L20 [Candidatus Dependentiae bacterium]